MPRLSTLVLPLLILALSCPAHGDIWNVKGGLGTELQKNRDTGSSDRYLTLFLAPSYLSPNWEGALDITLRWDSGSGDFDKSVWDRRGDALRGMNRLVYRSDNGKWGGGLEVLSSWTPGEGYLVRGLNGSGEVDYVLPGIRAHLKDTFLEVDAGMDRPVDPSVQVLAITLHAGRYLSLVLEGAVDPEAPVVFSDRFRDGRPVADETERLFGKAGGIRLQLADGPVLDLWAGAHTADLNGEAKGVGGDLSASLALSRLYHHNLSFQLRSVGCSGGYVPAWFDDLYAIGRWGPSGTPFLSVNPLGPEAPDRRMLSLNVDYELGEFFNISAGYDQFRDDSLRRARFGLKLREPNGRGLEALVWSRAEDPDIRLFSEEANLYTRVGALYNFLAHFLLRVSYEHSWAFREEAGGLQPVNSVLLGMMYNISL